MHRKSGNRFDFDALVDGTTNQFTTNQLFKNLNVNKKDVKASIEKRKNTRNNESADPIREPHVQQQSVAHTQPNHVNQSHNNHYNHGFKRK